MARRSTCLSIAKAHPRLSTWPSRTATAFGALANRYWSAARWAWSPRYWWRDRSLRALNLPQRLAGHEPSPATRQWRGRELLDQLAKRGTLTHSRALRGIVDES